jgi:LPXTG-motif cell wall-anchored protein
VYAYDVPVHPLTDVCTAEGGISLARDCATPDSVLATVEASGLTAGGVYGVSVVGTSPSGVDVVLASADVVSADGTLDGTLPLVSATGTVPLDGFTGFALLVDGQVFASVGATDAVVGTCVVPAPLPVAPVHPVASTTPAAGAHPTQPAALAQTGTETGSLLLLAGAFLVVGGLATLLARRTAR